VSSVWPWRMLRRGGDSMSRQAGKEFIRRTNALVAALQGRRVLLIAEPQRLSQERALLRSLARMVPNADTVIIEDHAKGLLLYVRNDGKNPVETL
jgi:hypothetical protein